MSVAVGGFIVFIIIATIILLILSTCIRVVSQVQTLVVERLGTYQGTYGVGIHFLTPLINRVVEKVNLKEQVEDFPSRLVIIKDNVTMQTDTVVFFYIADPKLYVYGVERPLLAIKNLTTTVLRNIIGDPELDQTLAFRETINVKIQGLLDIATSPRGIKVTKMELKSITPPSTIQKAMEEQMKAEYECRESALHAEGEKQSMTLIAEGSKESAVLNAETEREAAILRAEAGEEKKTKEAQGQVEAVRSVQQATADGIRFIKEARADNMMFQLKSLETSRAAANGEVNKIIIPSDIQEAVGMVEPIAEIAAKDKGAE